MAKSFSKKQIRVDVVLGQGTFDGSSNTSSFSGLETVVTIEKPGEPDQNKATVEISNVALDKMEQITTLAFKPLQSQKNTIAIFAGDENDGDLQQCFAGEITSAFADFSNAPTVVLKIEAAAGAYPQLKASPPDAVAGDAKAEDLIRKYASEAGYSFKNNGVTASVKNAVFNGDPITKAKAVAHQVGCEILIDDNVILIQPYDKARNENGAVEISAMNGLIGYPAFTSDGISFSCLFNPGLQLGGLISLDTIVPRAKGEWKITKLGHKLTANSSQSGQPWFSEVEAAPLDAKADEKKTSKNKKK